MNNLKPTENPEGKGQYLFGLIIDWLSLAIRSRIGFVVMLSSFRLLVSFFMLLLLLIFNGFPTDLSFEASRHFWLELIYLVFAITVVILVRGKPSVIDKIWFHDALWVLDFVLISWLIYSSKEIRSEIYLLYLTPIISAAHFSTRWKAVLQTLVVIGSYLISLVYIEKNVINEYSMLETMGTWITRGGFILASAWLYRMQRHIPEPDETSVVSPADVKLTIEQELESLMDLLEFDSASLQLLYRDRLQIIACIGFPEPEKLYRVEFPIDNPRFPNWKVLEQEQTVIVDTDRFDVFSDDLYHGAHIQTWMGIPLISPSTGEIFGMLSVDSSRKNAFKKRDEKRNAELFARRLASLLIEVALGPAAMTLAAKQNNQDSIMRTWAKELSTGSTDWKDDLAATRDLVKICGDIFNVEDCSVYFVRPNQDADNGPEVMHLVASTAIPEDSFGNNECVISGKYGTGLTGYAVYRRKLINYGANEINISPYRGNYRGHLEHLDSHVCKQLMIAPLINSHGKIIGAIKVENRLGWPSESRFPLFQQHLFEAFADLVVRTIENIRLKNYIDRQQQTVHNVRAIMAGGVLRPMDTMIKSGILDEYDSHQGEVRNIRNAIGYIANIMDHILADPGDILTLENEGLVPALNAFLDYMASGFPPFEAVYKRIIIHPGQVRDNLPFPVRCAFYNVGREALINILRHSNIHEIPNGQAEIFFGIDDDTYKMTIIDNGKGFSIEEKMEEAKCYGMRDMRKQIKGIEPISSTSEIIIDARPGSGTRIEVLWESK